MAGSVVVGCRLPHGLLLQVDAIEIELKGANRSEIIGGDCGYTTVDADVWAKWVELYKDFAPLKNGALFAVKDEAGAKAKAKEVAKEKTGFEGASQNESGVSSANA